MIILRTILLILVCGSATGQAFGQRAPEIPVAPNQAHRQFIDRAWMRTTPHAIVRSDMGYGEADRTAARIESVIQQAREVFPSAQRERHWKRVEVYLAGSRNDYLSLLRVEAGTDGTGSGGMHCWRGNEPQRVFVHGDSWPLLQHELWHAVVRQDLGDCPTWLNEGLAEIFAEGRFVGDQLVLGGVSAHRLPAARDLISRTGEPLKLFFQRDDSWNMRLRTGRESGNAQYTQAWLLMHFLLFADDGRHRSRVNCLLQRIQSGRSAHSAMHDCIGSGNLISLERAMADHVRNLLRVMDPIAFSELLVGWARATQGTDPEGAMNRLSDPQSLRRTLNSFLEERPASVRERLPRLNDCHVEWNLASREAVLRLDAADGTSWKLTIPAGDPRRSGDSKPPPPSVRWSMD